MSIEGDVVKRIYLIVLAAVAALLAIGGSTALASSSGPNPCATGTLSSGAYGGFTVTGTCRVVHGANVTINGNLTLADGAVFNALFDPSNAVHVIGNVKVGQGALLGLGYGTAVVVDGNVNANQPLSLYLGNMTVHGNVTSNGGGTADRFYNFPIKDDTIDGNLTLHGWTGGWIGALRNTVGGNIDFSNNASVVHPVDDAGCMASGTFPNGCAAAPGADPDSSEPVQNMVSGNLICHNNSPAAQFGDSGGGPNTVSGNKIGECAGL
jgi:hypothetical protein